VNDGKIRFLGDCTHEFAGQTMDLLDIEDDYDPDDSEKEVVQVPDSETGAYEVPFDEMDNKTKEELLVNGLSKLCSHGKKMMEACQQCGRMRVGVVAMNTEAIKKATFETGPAIVGDGATDVVKVKDAMCWEKCEMCGEFICNIHSTDEKPVHAHDCACTVIDEMPVYPYTSTVAEYHEAMKTHPHCPKCDGPTSAEGALCTMCMEEE
jgi:hypothetical protein